MAGVDGGLQASARFTSSLEFEPAGSISATKRRYELSEEELVAWLRDYAAYGPDGLRVQKPLPRKRRLRGVIRPFSIATTISALRRDVQRMPHSHSHAPRRIQR